MHDAFYDNNAIFNLLSQLLLVGDDGCVHKPVWKAKIEIIKMLWNWGQILYYVGQNHTLYIHLPH